MAKSIEKQVEECKVCPDKSKCPDSKGYAYCTKMKKDPSLIPYGYYCYTYLNDKYIPCPYWILLDNLPEHENGYCYYLEKSDYDINEKAGPLTWNNSKGEKSISQPHEIGISLIWDQCKECGIKLNDDEIEHPERTQ